MVPLEICLFEETTKKREYQKRVVYIRGGSSTRPFFSGSGTPLGTPPSEEHAHMEPPLQQKIFKLVE
jgi:hypothetical protein